MSCSADLKRAAELLAKREFEIRMGVIQETFESVVHGDPVTGSPGQPVDTGRLRDSWKTVIEGDTNALIATDLFYAQSVENGVDLEDGHVMNLKSPVGGFHSVALTRAGFQDIVNHVARKVNGQ